jgi:hypothetical protein
MPQTLQTLPRKDEGISMDHRCGTRFALSLAVDLLLGDERGTPCLIVVVSITGALIDTKSRLPPLSPLLLRRATPDHESVIEAYVLRNTTNGMALEWLQPGCNEVLELLSLSPRAFIARHGSLWRHSDANDEGSLSYGEVASGARTGYSVPGL